MLVRRSVAGALVLSLLLSCPGLAPYSALAAQRRAEVSGVRLGIGLPRAGDSIVDVRQSAPPKTLSGLDAAPLKTGAAALSAKDEAGAAREASDLPPQRPGLLSLISSAAMKLAGPVRSFSGKRLTSAVAVPDFDRASARAGAELSVPGAPQAGLNYGKPAGQDTAHEAEALLGGRKKQDVPVPADGHGYFVTPPASRETRFGPNSYVGHLFFFKGATIYAKASLLFFIGGPVALGVYLALLPLKITTFTHIGSKFDHMLLRVAVRPVRLAAVSALEKIPGVQRAAAGVSAWAGRNRSWLEPAAKIAAVVAVAAAVSMFWTSILASNAAAAAAAAKTAVPHWWTVWGPRLTAGVLLMIAGNLWAASSEAGRRWLKDVFASEEIDPRNDLLKTRGVKTVVMGMRSEQLKEHATYWGGLPSLWGVIVTRMRHTARSIVVADSSFDPASLPPSLRSISRVEPERPVRLTLTIDGKDRESVVVPLGDLAAGKPLSADQAALVARHLDAKWLLSDVSRILGYLAAAVVAGILTEHPYHLGLAVGMTVLIMLEINHKAHFMDAFRRHYATPGARRRFAAVALTLTAAFAGLLFAAPMMAVAVVGFATVGTIILLGLPGSGRALESLRGREGWSRFESLLTELALRSLDDHPKTIEAVVADEQGRFDTPQAMPLGPVATGIGAMGIAGLGLRQQWRAVGGPKLAARAGVFAAAAAVLLYTLPFHLAAAGALALILAVGLAGSALRYFKGETNAAQGPQPLGVTRAVPYKHAPLSSWPLATAAAGVLAAAAMVFGAPASVIAAMAALAGASLYDSRRLGGPAPWRLLAGAAAVGAYAGAALLALPAAPGFAVLAAAALIFGAVYDMPRFPIDWPAGTVVASILLGAAVAAGASLPVLAAAGAILAMSAAWDGHRRLTGVKRASNGARQQGLLQFLLQLLLE